MLQEGDGVVFAGALDGAGAFADGSPGFGVARVSGPSAQSVFNGQFLGRDIASGLGGRSPSAVSECSREVSIHRRAPSRPAARVRQKGSSPLLMR